MNIFQQSDYGSVIRKIKRFFKSSPYLPLIIVVLLVAVVAFFAIKSIVTKSSGVTQSVQGDKRFDISKPLRQESLNREFTFPLKDQNGKEVSKLLYNIQSVELRKEIVVKGQKATALDGRAFLIVNLKITNNYDKTIQINARDYLRVIIDNATEKLAPDIHNDPVEVQAISTKYTRLGLAINETDKNIVLQVGEISGKKDSLKLNLK